MDMTLHHILHVPVVEDGALCGIVSNDDVVKYAVGEMELEKSVMRDSLLVLGLAASMDGPTYCGRSSRRIAAAHEVGPRTGR